MKKFTVLLLMVFSVSVYAQDETLLQADKDFEAKSYDNALPVYLANKKKLSPGQEYNVGEIYYQKKEFEEAFDWFKKAANDEHAPAFVKLGIMYFQGKGVSKDEKQAFKWVKKSAETGDKEGMTNLGILYQQGTGVSKDYKEAFAWFTKGVDKGSVMAMYHLSNLYLTGNAGVKDETKGFELLKNSADKGYTPAMYMTGMYHIKGIIPGKNYGEAMKWFKMAADKNHAASMYEVGNLYFKGLGTAQSTSEALNWYKKSAALKYEGADKRVELIEKAIAMGEPQMVKVDAGSFIMGEDSENYELNNEPAHKVTLSAYYIGKYEITVEEYRAFCVLTGRELPTVPEGAFLFSKQKVWTDKHPIGNISWNDADEFCQWLSKRTGKTYRLPTEAEWEFAARGGNKSQAFKYSGSNNVDEVAWTETNSSSSTQIVGNKKPNELGIYDMSGNLAEWCLDFYAKGYQAGPATNPKGPTTGESKVMRGGSYQERSDILAYGFEAGNRGSTSKWQERFKSMGFRVVRVN